jgi:hypothetical protein
MGRGSQPLENCFLGLSPGRKLAVESIAVDMHDAYILACKKHLPNAKICVDRFHLTQAINKTFDFVRKSELQKAEDNFTQGMLAPSRRFVLVERNKPLIKSDKKMLEKLRSLNKNIHNSMLLVEYFHKILDKKNLKNFNLFFIGPQTSIGNMYLGPFFYYLIAPSLLLANFSPVGPAIFIGLVASIISNYAVHWKNKSTIDDTLDVFVSEEAPGAFAGHFVHQWSLCSAAERRDLPRVETDLQDVSPDSEVRVINGGREPNPASQRPATVPRNIPATGLEPVRLQ